MLQPRRAEDTEPTLWNTFNWVHERLVHGGDRFRTQAQPATAETPYCPSRRMRTRPAQGIAENTRLNKALWTLAEEVRKPDNGSEPMIYGRYSEGRRRECANCGHITSGFSYCERCDMVICDHCDHTCVSAEDELITETN